MNKPAFTNQEHVGLCAADSYRSKKKRQSICRCLPNGFKTMKTPKLFLAAVTVSTLLVTGCGDGTSFPADNNLVFEVSSGSGGTLGGSDEGFVDLALNIYTENAAYPVDGQMKYIVELTNPGPDAAPQPVVTVSFLDGVIATAVTTTSGFECSNTGLSVVCVDRTDTFGGLATFEIEATAPGVTGDVEMFAVASSIFTDLDNDNDVSGAATPIGLSTAGIQAQIDAAAPGATVQVAPGLYVGCLDFGGKDVNLQSTGGAESTTINALQCGAAVTIGPDGSLQGFTITDFTSSGVVDRGPGIDVSGTGTLISRNIFENNNIRSPASGKAIDGNNASPVIERNIFRNISCDMDSLSGTVGFVNSSSPEIRNNIFENNSCQAINMTLPAGNVPLVINNTIVGNDVGVFFDRRVSQVTQIYRNNIITANEVGVDADFGTDVDNPVWENNLLFDNVTDYVIASQTGTNGNISADPLFADFDNGDYRLLAGSPAIDSGNAVDAPADDYNGAPRPLDGDGLGGPEFDMGAFEAPTI